MSPIAIINKNAFQWTHKTKSKIKKSKFAIFCVLRLCVFCKNQINNWHCFIRSRFYSYTETPDEVSIILDEKSLALFPRSAFESGALKLASHTPWKAITLTLGASPCKTKKKKKWFEFSFKKRVKCRGLCWFWLFVGICHFFNLFNFLIFIQIVSSLISFLLFFFKIIFILIFPKSIERVSFVKNWMWKI